MFSLIIPLNTNINTFIFVFKGIIVSISYILLFVVIV
ncbi:hypothetical protein [Campylobacter phage CJLB-10]|nr:hypothetical protein [Campylobacter phage CJLB-10]